MRVGLFSVTGVAAQRVNATVQHPTIWNFALPFAAAALLVAMLVDNATRVFMQASSPQSLPECFHRTALQKR
jgi:hypothetical protein